MARIKRASAIKRMWALGVMCCLCAAPAAFVWAAETMPPQQVGASALPTPATGMHAPDLLAPLTTPLPVPQRYAVRNVTLHAGPLRPQLKDIAQQWGWSDVMWELPADYAWHGTTVFTAPTLPALCEQVLAPYPIQAVFYQGNHVLVFTPRRLNT